MKKLSFALSLIAGLLGGALSIYLAPVLVHAQARTAPPTEIRARSFVLVNDRDETLGTFSADQYASEARGTIILPDGTKRNVPLEGPGAKIKLTDPSGRVIWSAGGSGLVPLIAGR